MLNQKATTEVFVVLLLCSLVVSGTEVRSQSRQTAQVPWDVLDGSGGRMCSESYSVGGSLGQIAPGVTAATTRRVSAGYWAGIDTLPPCVSGAEFIRADADADMDVQMSDAIYTLKYLYVPGSPVPDCMDAADSDDGGSIAMSDAIYTLKYLYVPGSPAPPAPGPTNCGDDPTADGLDCGSHPCGGGYAGVKEAEPVRRIESVR